MPMSPMLESVGSTAHLQPTLPLDASADAEAMWHLSNHLNSLQLQQAQLSGWLVLHVIHLPVRSVT